ncbi:hypothetical protein SRABI96_00359 [Peribacillus sp. Bi96]|uniref:Ig-like domain-containing protein n=1 Tax=Peribacillus sp. Bi96 TaxID=2884273 RepID=UPI001DD74A33|nr:Ig-like domain-containing protein [Peribacillus sp. Bi96]CAH0136040.1 hypothetical protein SRABI96_00359 [Peribacillus sp. Bi96]
MTKQKAGKVLSVAATDKSGNTSSVKTVTVTVADKKAPIKPVVNTLTTKTTKVTGKVEAGSTVYVKLSGKFIGATKASRKGNFTVKISKQKAGKNLYNFEDKAEKCECLKKVIVKK